MFDFAGDIRPHVQGELTAATEAERRGDGPLAFRHLERAQVLAQAAGFEHVRVHARMFRFALRRGLLREAFGQLLRMGLAAPLSMLGLIPIGNTGGGNVNGSRAMPVPADLQRIIDRARREVGQH